MTAPHTFAALLHDAARTYGAAEAVVDGDRRVSYASLLSLVRRAAGGLVEAGIEPGDRVAVWGPNTLEWVVAGLAVIYAGAALVPINTRFKAEETAYILDRSGARLTYVSPRFLSNDYPAMLGDRPSVLLAPEIWDHPEVDAPPTTGEATGDVIFTSGTTGRPKGVVTAQSQTLRLYDDWCTIVGLVRGDRYLVISPFFHTFGYKGGLVACLLRGATIYPQASFDIAETLTIVERERITVLPGPPTMYQSILDYPDRGRYDLSSLRLGVTGASTVPAILVERMRTDLAFTTVLTGYGLTETTGTASICRQGDDDDTVANTAGRALPDTELAVVDPQGTAVPVGEPGEVVIRGYHVMREYLDDAEATARTIDADGWLHTGDIGILDARGNIRITDRLKDMYVVGGFNAYPAEIEQMLATHPAIADSAVIGIPDERLGEVGKAYLVVRPGVAFDPDELRTWCRERMANYKVPREVEVVEALPRNASGKVLKRELRQRQAAPPAV